MSDWVVVVMRQRDHQRKRVFVEGIESESEAKAIALSKLGVNSIDHDAYADFLDERVSLENPIHNHKEMYEQVVVELAEVQKKYQETLDLSAMYLDRAEKAKTERDYRVREASSLHTQIDHMKIELVEIRRDRERIQKVNQFIQARLANVRLELDEIQKLFVSIGMEI